MRQLLDTWDAAKKRVARAAAATRRRRTKRYFLATSRSALPFLETIAQEAERLQPGISVEAGAVPNSFFGETVTVAGLCTGRDVIRTLRGARKARPFDRVLLPAVMFNYEGFTLDGYSCKRLAKEAGVPVTIIDGIDRLLSL